MTEEQVIETEQAEELADSATAEAEEQRLADEQAAEEEAQRQADEQELEEQKVVEKKPWFKQRFDKITRQKYEERQGKEAAIARAEAAEKRLQELETAKPPEFKPTRPKPTKAEFDEQYDDPDEAVEAFVDAVTDWKQEQRDAKQAAENEHTAKVEKQQKATQTLDEKRQAIAKAGNKKFEDWEQVVFSIPLPIMNQQLAEAIMDIPDGESVAYYLGKNLVEAERVSQLSPYAMAAELGKIGAKIEQPPKKKTSKAPPPVKPVKGSQVPDNGPDPDKDTAAWIEARNKKERGR